jgi:hypothetical protein
MERVETELFSALGEELNNYAREDMGTPVTATAMMTAAGYTTTLPSLEELDSGLTKRKRRGSLGGDGSRSPNAKVLKEDMNGGETGSGHSQGVSVPAMRGD